MPQAGKETTTCNARKSQEMRRTQEVCRCDEGSSATRRIGFYTDLMGLTERKAGYRHMGAEVNRDFVWTAKMINKKRVPRMVRHFRRVRRIEADSLFRGFLFSLRRSFGEHAQNLLQRFTLGFRGAGFDPAVARVVKLKRQIQERSGFNPRLLKEFPIGQYVFRGALAQDPSFGKHRDFVRPKTGEVPGRGWRKPGWFHSGKVSLAGPADS